MKSVTKLTFSTTLSILTSAFQDNPGVIWVVKKDHRISARVQELCRFCLTTALQKEGAFITEDQKGAALLIKKLEETSSLELVNRLLPTRATFYRLG